MKFIKRWMQKNTHVWRVSWVFPEMHDDGHCYLDFYWKTNFTKKLFYSKRLL